MSLSFRLNLQGKKVFDGCFSISSFSSDSRQLLHAVPVFLPRRLLPHPPDLRDHLDTLERRSQEVIINLASLSPRQ